MVGWPAYPKRVSRQDPPVPGAAGSPAFRLIHDPRNVVLIVSHKSIYDSFSSHFIERDMSPDRALMPHEAHRRPDALRPGQRVEVMRGDLCGRTGVIVLHAGSEVLVRLEPAYDWPMTNTIGLRPHDLRTLTSST